MRDAETGKVVKGYGFDDCGKITAGSLDHTVTWKGSPDLANVQAKRVRAEFQLHGAPNSPQLYSFWLAQK